MLELYQFELSPYSEKIRLILDYKGLSYRKIEVTPGVGQMEVFRLSGQRKVPILKDGNTVIADSTAIAKYLDRQYPERPIIPTDAKRRGLCWLIEEWADESIAPKSKKVWFGAVSQNQNYRTSLLPNTTPDIIKNLVEAVPGDLLNLLGAGIGYGEDVIKAAQADLHQDLEALNLLLSDSPYLVAEYPTLADFAVAGLSLVLKFPADSYLNLPEALKGTGIPGIADNPAYETFFTWRDRLYADYRQPITSTNLSGSSPTSIEID